MLKIIISLIVLVLSASAVFAAEATDKTTEVKTQVETPVLLLPMDFIPLDKNCVASHKDDTLEQRGCCSHHGGVCGCSGGSVVCCDNTLSPSCTCRSDGIIQN